MEKKYRKENRNNVEEVRKKHSDTAHELELEDRMFRTTPRNAFVTLKDHKQDFNTRPAVRLINPTKNEMGNVAMQILDNIVKVIRTKTNLKQCTNTREVIKWFSDLKNKRGLKFIVYDIDGFYASITPKLLNESLEWASAYVDITPQQKKIILQASQSFLYSEGTPWVKKGRENFDIGMGAFHGAQACEIVGLFMLSKLLRLPNFQTILYRDDGLAVTTSTPRQQEKLKQEIIKIFGEHEMKITIEINLIRVDYLDVTLDLETGLYKPYRKPGDKPVYVSALSNHPPQILKKSPMELREGYQTIQPMRRFLRRPILCTKLSWTGVDLSTNWNTDQPTARLPTRKKDADKEESHGLIHHTVWMWKQTWARNF